MEKSNSKIIAVVALLVAVVALSVGFAAFTTTLSIEGNATVKTGTDTVFAPHVNFVSSASSPRCYATSDTTNHASVTGGTGYSAGDVNDNQWTGINVPLDEDNDYDVTCDAAIENTSSYAAYLTNIRSTGNADGKISCTSIAQSGASAAANPSAVCANTTVTVSISGNGGTGGSGTITSLAAITSPTLGSTSLNATNGSGTATVRIQYTGAAPDGDVRITLPTINFDFSTVAP